MAKTTATEGHTASPANREQTTKNAGNMPPKKSVEQRFAENPPPNEAPKPPITGGR